MGKKSCTAKTDEESCKGNHGEKKMAQALSIIQVVCLTPYTSYHTHWKKSHAQPKCGKTFRVPENCQTYPPNSDDPSPVSVVKCVKYGAVCAIQINQSIVGELNCISFYPKDV